MPEPSFRELAKTSGLPEDVVARATAIDASYNERITRQKESINRLLERLSAHGCTLNEHCLSCVAAGVKGGRL